MTQDELDRALRTITEALEHWVRTATTRKTFKMLLDERQYAQDVIEVLREHYVTHARF